MLKPPPRLLGIATLERLALDFEIAFFEASLARDPVHLPSLEALAAAYPRAGRTRDGLEVDRRLVAILPENPVAHYNLACSLAQLDEREPALAALEKAVALGYRDLDFMAKDPDLSAVRKEPRFKALVSKRATA